jgi:hypothetical protein
MYRSHIQPVPTADPGLLGCWSHGPSELNAFDDLVSDFAGPKPSSRLLERVNMGSYMMLRAMHFAAIVDGRYRHGVSIYACRTVHGIQRNAKTLQLATLPVCPEPHVMTWTGSYASAGGM